MTPHRLDNAGLPGGVAHRALQHVLMEMMATGDARCAGQWKSGTPETPIASPILWARSDIFGVRRRVNTRCRSPGQGPADAVLARVQDER